ncbi:MAG: helix-turn-helix transcriptional regulator, partial [Actinomycetota bacterium]
AALSGVTVRQIARYEAAEQQPALNVAVAIAAALDISVAELAGEFESQPDLSGLWTLAWEHRSSASDTQVVTDEVSVTQYGTVVRLATNVTSPDRFAWRGEFRLCADRVLVGWHQADDAPSARFGTLLLTIDNEAGVGDGRWVSVDAEGRPASGRAGIVRGRASPADVVGRSFGRVRRPE